MGPAYSVIPCYRDAALGTDLHRYAQDPRIPREVIKAGVTYIPIKKLKSANMTIVISN